MGKVYVIGVGMTKFEKPGVRNDPFPVLTKEALEKAFADANISYLDIEQAYVGYIYASSTSGQRALYEMGMTGIPIYNVNNNCAAGSTAILLAKESIEYGISDCVLALGFDKMQKGSLAFDYTNMTSPIKRQVKRLYSLTGKVDAPLATVLFGSVAREHMKKYGSRPEHFAKIAYKNHKHGSVNPYSQSQKSYTLDEILNSPMIFAPLTKLQCCPTSVGAAAAIFASKRFVIKHNLQRQAVELIGMEMATDLVSTLTDDSFMTIAGCEISELAAYKVYQKTKIHPTDVDVVELHDCFTPHELVLYEKLRLCPPGKAGDIIDQNNNTYGGKYVINPSGGLIGRGHPLGATGIAQCAELCWQLRGEAGRRQVANAKLALQHNYAWGGAVFVGLYKHGFLHQPMFTSLTATNREYDIQLFTKLIETMILVNKDTIFNDNCGSVGFELKMLSGKTYNWNNNDIKCKVSNEDKMTNSKNVHVRTRDNGNFMSSSKPSFVISLSEESLQKLLEEFKEIIKSDDKRDCANALHNIHESILEKVHIKSNI